MSIAYHTHSFEIPVASNMETQAGSISDKVVVPSGLASLLASYVTSTALTTTLANYALTADIGVTIQAYDADLAAIAALTSAADKVPYSTGAGTWALADFTPAGRALVDDADAAAQRTTLGLGTAATTAANAYATAAQGATADTAIQPGSNRLVPAGGTTGQVLAKSSGTDYATAWIAAGAGDMLTSANLSDLASIRTALANLGSPLISSGIGERTLLGVIRQSTGSGGWAFLNDVGHAPIGFNAATISQSTTDITLPFSFTGARVRSLLAVPDETFARRGLICGASVGTSSAILQLALPLAATVPVNGYSGALITDPAFVGEISSSHNSANGIVTITHPSVIEGGVPPILGATRGSTINGSATDSVGGITQAGGYGSAGAATTFEVQMHTEMAGYVAWTSGTSFSVTTDCAGTYSASWDGGTNRLTVTHPPVDSLYDLTISPAGTSFAQIQVFSVSKTQFVVFFLNHDGTFLTPLGNSFRLYFKRPSALVRKLPFTPSFVTFSRGHALVDPNKLYSASGNIWLFGVVETTS